MSVLRNRPESETAGTAYTFLKPMPSARPAQPESSPPPASRPDVGAILFPPRDGSPKPAVTGVTLGTYAIEEEIGRGGMGAVFRALDSRLDRIVALKVLGPDLSRDRSSVARFQNEARAAARLDHESIARVHDVGHDHGLYYIAFEFVPGSNLREVLVQNGGPLSPDEAVGYTLQIADALCHTSAVDVVHRDIKPSNIILSPTGRAKLVDWGLARQNGLELSQDLTQTGTTLGTFDYISPEQAIDPRNVDVRSDIYSLGCTLFHMLTGEPPYPRGSMFQKVLNHHRPEPPDASARNPSVPPELSDVVRRMMASEPDQRYATPDELVADLSSVATELGLRPTSPMSGIWAASYTRPPRERLRAGWGWLGAFVALIALVWSVDRSSRRLPLEPPNPAPKSETIAGTPAEPGTPVAPAAPDIAAPEQSPPRREGIGQGAANAPREFTQNRPRSSPGAGEEGVDVPALRWSLPDVVDSWKSLKSLLPAPAAGSPGRTFASPSQDFVLQSFNDLSTLRFSSLEAAMAAADDGDVIELDFDGQAAEIVRPIRTNKRLTIRAAARRRPQLAIGLTRADALSGLVPAPKIFSVDGGALTITDLDLVLTVPGGNHDHWSIFSLSKAARVTLRGVSITVENRDRRPVAIFDTAAAAMPAIARTMTEAMSERPVEIHIESCVVRGIADLILQSSPDLVDIKVAQSAFALNGAFYRQTAGSSAESGMMSRSSNELLLEHVTAILERPLVLIELNDREGTRPLQIDCRNSVFKQTDATQPLISISGQGDENDYLDSLSWNGRNNFFDAKGAACEIATPGLAGPRVTTLKFADWLSRWTARGASENEQHAGTELFSRIELWKDLDFSNVATPDFSLESTGTNPALQGADDGGNAGVDLEQRTLPKSLPVSPGPEAASRLLPRIRSSVDSFSERFDADKTRR